MVRQLLETTSQRAANYLEQLDQRLVRPEAEAVAGLAAFDEPLPSDPTAPEAILAMMDEIGSPATMAMAGPRFFGFVIGGSLPVTLAANWLAGAWDQNSALYNVTPATARLEQVALRWLIELFGLPENCSGAFVTGATVANFTALAAARHAVLEQAGWNVEADGLFGAPPITVIVGARGSPHAHQIAWLVGLGAKPGGACAGRWTGPHASRCAACAHRTYHCLRAGRQRQHRRVRSDWRNLPASTRRWRLGACGRRLWPLGRCAPSLTHLADGMQQADSWATDAHKWLNVPYDSGLAFVRDAPALRCRHGHHRRLPAHG